MSKSIGSVMYVCLGNINRSAVAEWITKKKLEEQKLDLEGNAMSCMQPVAIFVIAYEWLVLCQTSS